MKSFARSSCLLRVLIVGSLSAVAVRSAHAQVVTPTTVEPEDREATIITEADRLYRVQATPTMQALVIDGLLDEAEWGAARPLTEFLQAQPDEGAPVSELTEVRVLYDDGALYIGAILYDREPDQVVATVLRRDESHETNDSFAVVLDTYHDHRNGFLFETNALGAKYDAQIIGEGGITRQSRGSTLNRDWDAVWEAAGKRTAEGWSVELAIPFWSLRFDRDAAATWGINFRRTIRRKTEEAYWAPVPRQYALTRLSVAGVLTDLRVLGREKNLQLKPYALGNAGQFPVGPPDDVYAAHDTRTDGDLGLDAKWGISPSMTLDATVNTDFAQVEADDVQVNLTRFPLFFPEKREFFLENAGLFEFGGQSSNGARVLGFHSRNIGIYQGSEVPLLAGARLSGSAGDWNVGLLDMQTNSVDAIGLPSENHGVLRVRRNLGQRSSAGVLFTNRQSSSSDYNRELGLDARWAMNDKATIDAWWMGTDTGNLEGESEWAGQVRFEYASSNWQFDGSAMEVGDAFNPELGFVNRRDIRSYDSTLMWTPYFPDSPWLRNLSPHAQVMYVSDRDNRLLTRRWHLDWDLFLKRGDKLSVSTNRNFEQLDFPYEIVPGVIIQPGAYHFAEYQLEMQSERSRPVYGNLTYTWGDYWDGTYKNLNAGAGFRLGPRFNMSGTFSRTDAELVGGDFVVDLWSTRISYDFNTRLSFGGLFQYDNLSDQFLSNVRMRFIYTPGSDIYLVYNERRLTEDPSLIDRALIIKVTKLFRI